MIRKNNAAHPNLILLVFAFFVLTLICSPVLAKKYPTSTVIKNVNVNGDTELNIVVPWGVVVSVHVTNSKGVPVEGVVVTSFGKNFYETNTAITDKNGDCRLSLRKGKYGFTLIPTSNESREIPKTLENVNVKKNTKINATLEDGVFISCTLLDYLNQPVTDSVVYAVNQSDNWAYVFTPDPVTGQIKGPVSVGGNKDTLTAGENYDITAVRTSCVDLPYQPFRVHTNTNWGKMNIQDDIDLGKFNMQKGVVLQGKVSTENNQMISLKGTVTDKDNQLMTAVITILAYKYLKDRSAWIGAQTAITSYIDSSYKAALEKKNKYALQVAPIYTAVGEASINAASSRATYKIIPNIKMKNKNKTSNITLPDGNNLFGTMKDKKGNVIKGGAVIITNARKPKDVFNKNKVMLVTITNDKGKFSYYVPNGKWDVYGYSPNLDLYAGDAGNDWNELNTKGENIQDYLIRILTQFRKNLMARSTRK